ncbi:MAG: aldo/keto reductase [Acidobacteria bacterium]|nr:aldo/keto reductase [Acidobacteriota bacterium]MBI3427015.1 aldo/keto reductase [Acidobacteriota bacterium]
MAKHATPAGTRNYCQRFAGELAAAHFRQAQGLWLSSIGLGTYLGQPDERTDAAYQSAVKRAVALGCNVIDTASNYRFQRSERCLGEAFTSLFAEGATARAELVVTTKGGFVPFDGVPPRSQSDFRRYLEETFINTGICAWEDFVQGQHCMTPKYLAHQLEQSLRNLQLEAVDVYYLHNPESQLAEVAPDDFYARLQTAFEFLEEAVAAGKLAMYGTATWNGYRVPLNSTEYLSLERVVQTARAVAGDRHHFKVVQLPINLAMTEAFTHANQMLNGQPVTFLEAAAELGITVMTSGSILQSRLASGLPPIVNEAFPGLRTDAQRALQFVRSTPGVTTALVGMSQVEHVAENLALAKIPPAATAEYLKLFSKN